jgi:hypothetical protein
MTSLEAACKLFLPKDTLTYFDIVDAEEVDNEVHIKLTEKNNPPEQYKHKKLFAKGFKTFTVSDFPVRGKPCVLTYNRRYWQAQGEKEYVTNDLSLVATGTKLEAAFAEVLKKRGGDYPDILGEYRDFIPHPTQGV